MNAATGIESDNDSVTPVGLQCELNPADNALPSPASPNHANRFTDVQLCGFHGLFAGGGEILRSERGPAASLSKHSGSGGEDLLALRSDVPVEVDSAAYRPRPHVCFRSPIKVLGSSCNTCSAVNT